MARSSVIEGTPGFGVDTRDLTRLAVAMRNASVTTRKSWRVGMLSVGEVIATEARARASEFSTSIPPTIKVRVSRATVEVRAGTKEKPLARLFELGNTGHHQASIEQPNRSGSFKHPVFGDESVWVSQAMHPFLYQAWLEKEQEARDDLAEVIARSLRAEGIATETY